MLRLLLPILLTLGLASGAAAQSRPWKDSEILRDPEWRKSFLGSYGFLSGAEPQINETERMALLEVIELMKADTKAAATVLGAQAGADSSAALDFILANLQFQNGELDAAAEGYERAIGKFPDFRRAHKNLGLLRVQKSDFPKALEHLSRAIELGDRDGRAYGLIGYCYVNRENYLAAEEAYRNAILQEPETRDWKLGLARALMSLEKYEEAIGLFDVLIAEKPEDSTAWMLQANAYVGLDRPRDAAVNLEAVRMMGMAQTSSLVLLGDIYMNEGMYDLAKEAYLDVIATDKGSLQLGTSMRAADLLVRARAFDQASEVLESVEKRYTKMEQDDELRVLTLQAKVARAKGREKQAADLLESIVARDGMRGDALLELAAYHRNAGNKERAILLYERARNLEAYEYRALVAQAQFLVGEKEYAEAAALLRDALAIRREARVERFLARVEDAVRPR